MNDAKPDVASLPAKCCANAGTYVCKCNTFQPAALATAREDGLPKLPEAGYQRGLMADHPDLFTADQMFAIRDAGIAYGRHLTTTEQPEARGVEVWKLVPTVANQAVIQCITSQLGCDDPSAQSFWNKLLYWCAAAPEPVRVDVGALWSLVAGARHTGKGIDPEILAAVLAGKEGAK